MDGVAVGKQEGSSKRVLNWEECARVNWISIKSVVYVGYVLFLAVLRSIPLFQPCQQALRINISTRQI